MRLLIYAFLLCVALCSQSRAQAPQDPDPTTSASRQVATTSGQPIPSIAATVPFDVKPLHSAFRFSAQDFQRWVKRGSDEVKKGKSDDIWERARRTPVWVRGKRGRADASVWLDEWDGMAVARSAFDSANVYESAAFSPDLPQKGGYITCLRFYVRLMSEPGTDYVGGKTTAVLNALSGKETAIEVTREADENEVDVLRVVITDDKGNVYPVVDHSDASPIRQDTVALNLVDVYKSDAIGVVASALAVANHTYCSKTSVPYSENHPWFEANYDVGLSLFDDKGVPRIPADATELTLHIVTKAGEMCVAYDLSKFHSGK